jgi:hypothetical protein
MLAAIILDNIDLDALLNMVCIASTWSDLNLMIHRKKKGPEPYDSPKIKDLNLMCYYSRISYFASSVHNKFRKLTCSDLDDIRMQKKCYYVHTWSAKDDSKNLKKFP